MINKYYSIIIIKTISRSAELSKIKFLSVCIFTMVVLITPILGCQSKNISITSLEDGKVGTIKFPTRDVTGFQDMLIGEKVFLLVTQPIASI